MLLALAWGLGAQSNAGCTTHSPDRVQRGPHSACWGSRCQGCPQQDGQTWSPFHHPATFSEDCMVGLGIPQSSSSIVSGERWMGRGWKSWWGSDAAGVMERETFLSRVLRVEHPCSPPHWAPPSPKPAASEPARQKPGCSELSEQRDAPFSYHGNLSEKFLKFRQGNFSSRCDFVIAWLAIPQGSSVLPHSSASKVGSGR